MVAEELNIDKEMARQIITNNFNLKEVYNKVVLKNLNEEQKLKRK
jgi:hypothetical protein